MIRGNTYSNLELKYARPLADALIESAEFRQWALAGTCYQDRAASWRHDGEMQRAQRGRPSMTNPYWFNYWCGKDTRCSCRIGTAVETDILLIFEDDPVGRVALHVEVKRPGDSLGDGQAATYPRRAACWAMEATRPRGVVAHSEFATILACGENLADAPDVVAFDRVLFHSDIGKRLSPYPES